MPYLSRYCGAAALGWAFFWQPWCCWAIQPAAVLPPAAGRQVDFLADIQPLFLQHCLSCHGADKQESNYRLDRKAEAFQGGDFGEPAIVPGQAEKSPLLRFVAGIDADTTMPPKGPRLKPAEVGLVRAWIEQGAPWPAEADGAVKLVTRHWSFQPVAAVVPPLANQPTANEPLANQPTARNEVDLFVAEKLAAAGLSFSPPADRRTLLRRLLLDLHGIPPTPEELAAFLHDPDPRAYERLVERALASPRYGQRWASHWLDVVRYAETNGFETNVERANAYPYRDYVIAAFNHDLPYNRFVLEQLAGDVFGVDAATGFLVAGPWDQVKSPDPALTAMQRSDELADMTNTTGTTFLGLTVGCARCHNHKFDPVLQTDYYALQAVFAGVQHGERPLRSAPSAAGPGLAKRPAVNSRLNEEEFPPTPARFVRFTVQSTNNGSEPCLDELEVYAVPENGGPARNVALASSGAKATSSGNYAGDPKHQLPHVHDGLYGNGKSWISSTPGSGWVQLELPESATLHRIVWGRDREEKYADRTAVRYEIEIGLEPGQWRRVASSDDRSAEAPQGQVYAGRFQTPAPTHRLFRGDPMQPREEVVPDCLQVMGRLKLEANTPEQNRRLALARWIADEQNPLTARVIVNRLWQHHFGTGLVDTPSDFGASGSRPSHPELLDWLARRLVSEGWSLKQMHRVMLLSHTYRQSSAPRPEGLERDAQCRLLWRFAPRRLEAEAIRDSLLAVAGSLDEAAGGPGWSPFKPNTNYVRVYDPKDDFGPADFRRSVYMFKVRMRQDGVFGTFDCPDGGLPQPKRSRSTTALQALSLLNSNLVLQQAEALARRVEREAGQGAEAQVGRAFQLTLSREPAAEELAPAAALIKEHGLSALGRALFNANEFLFLP